MSCNCEDIIKNIKLENEQLKELYDDLEKQHMKMIFINNMLNENIMTLEINKNGDILYASELFLKFIEYRENELRDINIYNSSFIDQNSLKELRNALIRSNTWNGEIKYITKSDDEIWVNCRVFPIINSEHNIEGYKFIKTDITQNKKIDSYLSDIFSLNDFKIAL